MAKVNLDMLNRLMGSSHASPPNATREAPRSNTGAPPVIPPSSLRVQDLEGMAIADPYPYSRRRNIQADSLAIAVRNALDERRNVACTMNIEIGAGTREVTATGTLRINGAPELHVDHSQQREAVGIPLLLRVDMAYEDLQYLSSLPEVISMPALTNMVTTTLCALVSTRRTQPTTWKPDPDLVPPHVQVPCKTLVEVKSDNGPTENMLYSINTRVSQSIVRNIDEHRQVTERVLLAAKLAVQAELETIVRERREGTAPKPSRRIDLD